MNVSPAAIITDDEHGPSGDVPARNQAVEIYQRQPLLHRKAQTPVVGMVRVRAAVSIAQQFVRTEGVVIRPIGRGRDGQWRVVQDLRLEDALRTA